MEDRGLTTRAPDGAPLRVLDLMEAHSVTGPAKNLFELALQVGRGRCDASPIDIRIATFQRGQSQREAPFVLAARQLGLRVALLRERFAWDPTIIPQLRELVHDLRPDIVQTHNFKSHFLVRLTGTHRACRWIAFHHGYTRTDLKNLAYNQLDRWSLPAAHQVVTVCRSFARDLERIGVSPARIAIQHNMIKPFAAVPFTQTEALRAALGIPAGTLVLLAVGRLSREKGHVDLVDAMIRLNRDAGDLRFRLVIVGDGPERGRIRERADASGVASKILLVGHQHDVSPYYSIADLMILPSHSEGSPNVLLEAMAAGLPSVVTNAGGIPEIARHEETALIVEKNDPAALANAIGRLLRDEQLRAELGHAARDDSQRYEPENYCAAMRRIYEALLGKREAEGSR